MKLSRKFIFNVVITLSILSLYLFFIGNDNSEMNLNDLSFVKDDCARNCKTKKINIMLCLDSCTLKEVVVRNPSNFGFVFLSLILCAIYIKYKYVFISIFEGIVEKFNLSKNYNYFRINNNDDETDMNHYHKITDI